MRAGDEEDVRRQALIVFSDGEDTSSLVSFDEVLDLAKRSETAIFTIALRGPNTQTQGLPRGGVRHAPAGAGNGRQAYFPAKIDDLNGVYGQIADELSSQYTLGYTSKNTQARRRLAARRRPGRRSQRRSSHQARLLRANHPVNAFRSAPLRGAGVAYAIHFSRRIPRSGVPPPTLLLVGVLAHTFVIGMQTMEVRHVPFANPSRAVSTFVWLLTLSYLYLELDDGRAGDGRLHPAGRDGLQIIPAVLPGTESFDPVLDSPWFWLHVSSLLFAYASFALAGVLGLTYMLQFKEIKKKHLGSSTRVCRRCRCST